MHRGRELGPLPERHPRRRRLDLDLQIARQRRHLRDAGDERLGEHAVLGEDHEYDGLALLAGDKVRFREGKIVWANVANEHDIGGKTYPAEANLTIKNGRVVGSSTAEERAAKAEAAARERQNRYDACTMQCAPLTGIPRANCINNCQTYR